MERERRVEGGRQDELGARGKVALPPSSRARGKPTTFSGDGEGRAWLVVGLGVATVARVPPVAPGRSASISPHQAFQCFIRYEYIYGNAFSNKQKYFYAKIIKKNATSLFDMFNIVQSVTRDVK